jgi:hypothetical protein
VDALISYILMKNRPLSPSVKLHSSFLISSFLSSFFFFFLISPPLSRTQRDEKREFERERERDSRVREQRD